MKASFQIRGCGKTLNFKFHMDTFPLQMESLECVATLMRAVLLNIGIDADVDEDEKAQIDASLRAQLLELEDMKRDVWKRHRSVKGSSVMRLLPIQGSPHVARGNSTGADAFTRALADALDSADSCNASDAKMQFPRTAPVQSDRNLASSGDDRNRHLALDGPEASRALASETFVDEGKSTKRWKVPSLNIFSRLPSSKVAPESRMTVVANQSVSSQTCMCPSSIVPTVRLEC